MVANINPYLPQNLPQPPIGSAGSRQPAAAQIIPPQALTLALATKQAATAAKPTTSNSSVSHRAFPTLTAKELLPLYAWTMGLPAIALGATGAILAHCNNWGNRLGIAAGFATVTATVSGLLTYFKVKKIETQLKQLQSAGV